MPCGLTLTLTDLPLASFSLSAPTLSPARPVLSRAPSQASLLLRGSPGKPASRLGTGSALWLSGAGGGSEEGWVSVVRQWSLELLAPCDMVMDGASLYIAIDVILGWCASGLAFLTRRPGTLSTVPSSQEPTAPENPQGCGWRLRAGLRVCGRPSWDAGTCGGWAPTLARLWT